VADRHEDFTPALEPLETSGYDHWLYRAPRKVHMCRMPRTWFGRVREGDRWECRCGNQYEWGASGSGESQWPEWRLVGTVPRGYKPPVPPDRKGIVYGRGKAPTKPPAPVPHR
jgi:hypothetical protein